MKTKVRSINRIQDFKMLPEIQRSAWGFSDLELEPHALMTQVQKYGGLVQGLYLEDALVGFTYAVIGKWQGEYFIFSHMLAVRREYQGRGFGFRLKKGQRIESLKMGYDTIRWNFDPLEALNAYFNLHRLGAFGDAYEVNAYGEGESGLHMGLPTDRLVATWPLRSPQVEACMRRREPPPILDPGSPPHIGDFSSPHALIEIPIDIRSLKQRDPIKARYWRLRTRAQFRCAFKKKYIANGIAFNRERTRLFVKLRPGTGG